MHGEFGGLGGGGGAEAPFTAKTSPLFGENALKMPGRSPDKSEKSREDRESPKKNDRRITHLICVRLKHLLYDFWGVLWASFLLFFNIQKALSTP